MYNLIVTDDSALIVYLHEAGIVDIHQAPVMYPATARDVAGKHVIGKLSHYLSSFTASYTEIPLRLPSGLKNVKLVVADYEKYADSPVTYEVVKTFICQETKDD